MPVYRHGEILKHLLPQRNQFRSRNHKFINGKILKALKILSWTFDDRT